MTEQISRDLFLKKINKQLAHGDIDVTVLDEIYVPWQPASMMKPLAATLAHGAVATPIEISPYTRLDSDSIFFGIAFPDHIPYHELEDMYFEVDGILAVVLFDDANLSTSIFDVEFVSVTVFAFNR